MPDAAARVRRAIEERATSLAPGAGPFFHGGVRGLTPGDLLLPPQDTGSTHEWDTDLDAYDDVGRDAIAGFFSLEWFQASRGLRRADRVYITTDLDTACVYANETLCLKKPQGMVYEVEPLAAVEYDLSEPVEALEDYTQFTTAQARVSRVVREYVPWNPMTSRPLAAGHPCPLCGGDCLIQMGVVTPPAPWPPANRPGGA